jgi:ribonuclease HI
MKTVRLTTDGACNPNPGRGGWAAILRFGSACREISGGAEKTTNNVMELTAIVEGLRALKEPCVVVVRTDSKNALAWCRPGALDRIRRSPKRSAQLAHAIPMIAAFVEEARRHELTFEWVRGHNGDPDNEACDRIADSLARQG